MTDVKWTLQRLQFIAFCRQHRYAPPGMVKTLGELERVVSDSAMTGRFVQRHLRQP